MALLCLLLFCLTDTSSGQNAASKSAEIGAHLQRAQDALRAKTPDIAVKELRAVLALDPKNADAHANLGVIDFFAGNYRSASQELRSALTTDPSLTNTQALLGICEKRLGDASAQALLESSFPNLQDNKLRTQVGRELIALYSQHDDLDRSASVVRSLVEMNPEDVEILYMAQRVYAELADDTLNKLAVLAPGSARMREVIAERLVNAGDLKGAIEHYRKALEIDPHLPGVHYELGEAILESSRSNPAGQADAEKEFEAAVKIDGDSAKTECLLGKVAFFRTEMEQAYAHYHRAYTLNPNDAEAQIGLGSVLMTMEKPQEAIKYLRMAVQSDPLSGEAHYRLSVACKKLNLTDEAQKELKLFGEIK